MFRSELRAIACQAVPGLDHPATTALVQSVSVTAALSSRQAPVVGRQCPSSGFPATEFTINRQVAKPAAAAGNRVPIA